MTARKQDENGYIIIKDNPISRVGVFQYLGRDVGDDDPNRVVNVYRPADALADPECIESFKLIPIVDDHDMLGPTQDGYLAPEKKGVHGTVGEAVDFRDGVLYANLKIFSETLANLIKKGKKDLSIGYRCAYEKASGVFAGQSYDYIQRSLRGNHLALVDQARCDVAVLDHKFAFDSLELDLTQKENEMNIEELKKAKEAADAKNVELQAALDAANAETAKLKKAAQDAEEAEKKKKEEEEAAAAEDADEEGKEEKKEMEDMKKSMDSMAKDLKAAQDTIAAMQKDAVKTVMDSISKRDALAKDLAVHIGTFDHSSKTLDEVAKYGIEKLKITCEEGQERAALDGFLQAKKQAPAFTAKDSRGTKSSELNSYFANEGA